MSSSSASSRRAPDGPVTVGEVLRTWWPLAASWLLMGLELPAVAAVVSRLDPSETKSQLAAYGSFVFPIAVLIEGPIIMMLAASTALCRDAASYFHVRRFMMWAGLVLTVVHGVVAFTPVYDVLMRGIIDAPEAVIEPARLGLMAMLPWTWAIAYRRFQQGVLIRFGRSRLVGVGTIIRLLATVSALLTGYAIGSIPGAAVGAASVSFGVIVEAIYAGIVVRPVLREHVIPAPPESEPLTGRKFAHFYLPLALTPVLTIVSQPIIAWGLSHMPRSEDSVACWPAIYGLVFLLRSLGMAYNEVVVALLGRPEAVRSLVRFTALLGASSAAVLATVAFSPLSRFWFTEVVVLEPGQVDLAVSALRMVCFLPALSAMQSWFQGLLVHRRRTRAVTESVAVMLVALTAVLVTGVTTGATTGLYIGLLAYASGSIANIAWLAYRSRATDTGRASTDAVGGDGTAAAEAAEESLA